MFNARRPQPMVSQALSVPAPTGGINDLDPLAAMDPLFMIDCMNLFPDTATVQVRPGYQEWVTNLGLPVKTIMNFNALDGTSQVFAATDAAIYNITASTSAPASGADSAGNGMYEFTNFATTAGQYLVAVNSAQAKFYDGTTWHNFSEVATPAAPGEISGVNPATFSHVYAHKGRLWFLQKDSMTAWYLPIDSIGGVAQPFFLGGIFRRGGKLVSLARWSADTGVGLDDRIIFVTSAGEVASYRGNDPSSADDWFLDSVFFIAAPLSARSVADYGGDVLLLCHRGLVPLSNLINGKESEILYSGALTRRISRTLIRLTAVSNLPYPAEVGLHSETAWVYINIYDGVTDSEVINNKPIQLIMNFLTGAWGKFDYPVRTLRSVGKLLFMGTDDGRVLIVTPDSYRDNVSVDGSFGGDPVEAYGFSAYSYLGNQTANKHAKLIRPVFQTQIPPSFRMRTLPDFRLDPYTTTPPPGLITGFAKWDIAIWDEGLWSGFSSVYRPWVSANQLGFAFAWQMRISTSAPLGIAALEWVWEAGGYV